MNIKPFSKQIPTLLYTSLIIWLLVLSTTSIQNAKAQSLYPIISYTFDPYVIPAGITTPVKLTVHTDNSVTSLVADLQAGGSVAATLVSPNTFQLIFMPAQVLFNYTTSYNHNFFGYLNTYSGTSLVFRLGLVANVSDNTIPSATINNLAPDARASAHIVNLLVPNAVPGSYDANIIRRFYQLYPDNFDFISQIYVDNVIENRTHTIISNSIQGIGLSTFNSSNTYGSAGKLRGITNFPTAAFFDGAEAGFQHELGHQWINYTTIPGGPHWPISELAQGIMGLSVPGSGGVGGDFPFEMTSNADGSYTLHYNNNLKWQVGFTDLDLYLMGLLPAAQVQPAIVFSNQNQTDQLHDGGILQGPTYLVDANTVIATYGPRIPDASTAQRNFNVASIIITRDRLLTAPELAFFDYMASRASFTQAVPYASGLISGTAKPFYITTRSLATLNSNMLIIPSTISGNVGVAGANMSYTDGTPKTAISLENGSYSLPVSNGWSGTVTPSHPCFTFTPASRSYSNVVSNQTSQNYTPTLKPASGCADINVLIAGANQGRFGILPHGGTRASFAGVNNGPVKIASTNAVSIMGAERVINNVNGVPTSFSEMMGLPDSQLNTTYWMPWYNNVALDTQLRFGNVSGSAATVHVFIGGSEMNGSPYTLTAGQSKRVSFAGVNNGPVKVVSNVNIVAAERIIYNIGGIPTSFSEIMGLPDSQLNTTYWMPWYNNVNLDTQLRFGNVSGSNASVNVYIHGSLMNGSPFTLTPGQSKRVSFAGVNNGPVKVVSDVNIVAAERVIYNVNGVPTSFSEIMGLPNSQLSTTYWMPWYNNVDLDTQLRLGNVSGSTATVHVFIGGSEMPGSPYILNLGESKRVSFAGVNNGPVKIVSNVNIVAAERVIYKINGVPTSFSELMGLPKSQLNTIYWLPWYNNVDLDTQLRFGVP